MHRYTPAVRAAAVGFAVLSFAATADDGGTRDGASWQLKDPKSPDVAITGHVLKPKTLEPTEAHVRQLKLPPGFRVARFAEGLGQPRIIAVADDGTVYVTRRQPGDLLMLRDTDGDGRADVRRTVLQRPQLHGVTLDGNRAFFATVTEVLTAQRKKDGTFGPLKVLARDLPEGGQHPNRTLAVGPDRRLYVSVGSTCNACAETSPEIATLLRMGLDGKGRGVFARGLRNTIGFAWHPRTGQLWGLDHGIDWLGDEEQKEELNLLEEGQQYGWPYVFADGKFNPADAPPGEVTHAQWAQRSRAPALLYTAHAAPMQLVFYKGKMFPEEYREDAFATMRGSWNRKPPSGYEVVRLRFREGKPVAVEPFLTGFLVQQEEGNWGQFARPVGLAVAPDGALLVGDDGNGVIYRITYQGSGTSTPGQ